MKKTTCLIFLLLVANIVSSQENNLIGTRIDIKRTSISEEIETYKAYEVNLFNFVHLNSFNLKIDLAEDYSWDLVLTKNNLKSKEFESNI